MLSVNRLTCGYSGVNVLKDISFTASTNKKLLIVGPNGCGKTTLLKAIAGLIPYQGTVMLGGQDTATLRKKELSKKVALLSQTSNIYFSYSVYETVMHGRYVHLKNTFFKGETRLDQEVVLSCLKRTGLLELKDKNIKELSGGQLQRVFLARVLAQEPEIILLDEPTNHLDLRYQLELMTYLDEWVQVPDRIVVGVVHDMNLAFYFADDLMMIKDGKIVAWDRCESIDLDLINQIFDIDVTTYMKQSLKKWER
jgi:iron complex transport system ATP-binding protein